MNQVDRDRLVAMRKAAKGLITRQQAAAELKLTERQVYRLLAAIRERGDKGIIHRLRGQRSNRKLDEELEQKAMEILGDAKFHDYGPTLASQYLARTHRIRVSKETLRQWMMRAGLWQGRKQRITEIHVWRQRRERLGELVQWDTSEHDWLEGRGEKIYLVTMIDDATSRVFARFVRHDSTQENMAVLEQYLRRFGRPLEFYTDKASIFHTTPKKNHPVRGEPLPPTQIGRALEELAIGWIAAHSPQAKGRVERSFQTAQDRLVKLMRAEGITTLEGANAYLENEYLPEWEARFTQRAACGDNAHRPLGKQHELKSILCRVEQRVITNDYTFRLGAQIYQIERRQVRPRLRGASVRVEQRCNGDIAVRFEGRYLAVSVCEPSAKPKSEKPRSSKSVKASKAVGKSRWMDGFFRRPAPKLHQAIAISNATS